MKVTALDENGGRIVLQDPVMFLVEQEAGDKPDSIVFKIKNHVTLKQVIVDVWDGRLTLLGKVERYGKKNQHS